MGKSHNLLEIPKDEILLIDASAFQLEDYDRLYRCCDMHSPSTDYLRADYSRFIKLKEVLSNMDNWTTTKEIVTEFRGGNKAFKEMAKEISCNKIKKLYNRITNQRRKVLSLLNNRYRIIDYNLTSDLKRITNHNKKLVERIFQDTSTPHKLKKNGDGIPDIKLINFALAYAIQGPCAGVFSHDHHLLNTFVKCSKRLYLGNKTFCLADQLQRPVKTKDLKDNYF